MEDFIKKATYANDIKLKLKSFKNILKVFLFNSFLTNVTFSMPPKVSENRSISVFWMYRKGNIGHR